MQVRAAAAAQAANANPVVQAAGPGPVLQAPAVVLVDVPVVRASAGAVITGRAVQAAGDAPAALPAAQSADVPHATPANQTAQGRLRSGPNCFSQPTTSYIWWQHKLQSVQSMQG